MVAAIDLQKHPTPRVAFSAAAMLWSPSLPGAGQTDFPANAPHGGAGDPKTIFLVQDIRQMVIVEVCELLSHQLNDLVPHFLGELAMRCTPTIAVR
jgi:hypothetical protein